VPTAVLLAQCAPSGPCELPTGLPWYFGLAVAVVWLAAVVGALLLARRFLLRRIRERRRARDHRPALEQTTSGHDLERW
jgi:heme exporter protein D